MWRALPPKHSTVRCSMRATIGLGCAGSVSLQLREAQSAGVTHRVPASRSVSLSVAHPVGKTGQRLVEVLPRGSVRDRLLQRAAHAGEPRIAFAIADGKADMP